MRTPQFIKDREEMRKSHKTYAYDPLDDTEDEDNEDPELVKRSRKYLGEASTRILSMIERKEEDGAVILIQRALLSSALNLLTDVEDNAIESGGSKGIYAYNALISQIRELIGDIQNSQDTALIADSIGLIVKQQMRGVAQAIIDQHHSLKQDLRQIVEDTEADILNKKIDAISKELAAYLSDASSLAVERIRERIVD